MGPIYFLSRKAKRQGMTLIEVLVASVVFSIAALTALMASHNVQRLNQAYAMRNRVDIIVSSMQDRVRYASLCTESFQSIDVGPMIMAAGNVALAGANLDISMSLPDVRVGEAAGDPNTVSASAPNNTIVNGTFIVQRLALSNWYSIPNTDNGSTKDFFANLNTRIVSNTLLPPLGGQITIDRVLGGLILRVNLATREIVECTGSTLNSISEICTEFGCEYDALGNPPCNCDRPPIGCAAGQLPVAVRDNIFECRAWGGSCPDPTHLVVSAGIESVGCAPPPPAAAVAAGPDCSGGGPLDISCCAGPAPVNDVGAPAVCCGVDPFSNPLDPPQWFPPDNGISVSGPIDPATNESTSYTGGFFCGCGNSPVFFPGAISGC